jgi:hypothetical protein
MLNRLNEAQIDTVPHDGTARTLHRDYETRSQCVLKSAGVHRYAADPRTDVMCCAYAVDDDPVQLWTPGDAIPPEFIAAASKPKWEFPRLCRGGSKSLTYPAVGSLGPSTRPRIASCQAHERESHRRMTMKA